MSAHTHTHSGLRVEDGLCGVCGLKLGCCVVGRGMGVIEGGSVSGMLPARRVFAVNYPAYPSSLARATQTLGGEETIAKVCYFFLSCSISFIAAAGASLFPLYWVFVDRAHERS